METDDFVEDEQTSKPVEYRLYYDDRGKVVCYTTGEHQGSYLVIDSGVYAEMRYDVTVVDGKIVKDKTGYIAGKLVPADSGQSCAAIDISVIATDNTIPTKKWNMKYYDISRN